MRNWFLSLGRREQWILSVGGVLSLVLLGYALLWDPFDAKRERLEQRVSEQQELLQWMEEAAQEVKQRRATSDHRHTGSQGVSLLGIVDRTAKREGLRETVKRVEPEGHDGVRLWLEQVPFDTLVIWLERLALEYGVNIESITLDRYGEEGKANARVLLRRPSG